jgi:hypothetical protein
MRTRIPFIEALRREQERKQNIDSASPTQPSKPEKVQNLSPKSMSDSHHRVVSHVTGKPCHSMTEN